jgi:hypothetical protein
LKAQAECEISKNDGGRNNSRRDHNGRSGGLVAETQEASVVAMVSGADLAQGRTAAVPVRHAVEIHSVIKNHAATKNVSYNCILTTKCRVCLLLLQIIISQCDILWILSPAIYN